MFKRYYGFLKNFLFDLFFPRICLGCGSEGFWVCGECIKKIRVVRSPFCSECRKLTIMGEFCEICRDRYRLDGIIVCAHYEDGVLKELVHDFKYSGVFDIGDILGEIVSQKLQSIDCCDFDILIPVPLHKKRFGQRGFNQSEILAQNIASNIGHKVNKQGLRRVVDTKPQADMERERRLTNLANAFVWKGDSLSGKNILLVDDITTTGTTLNECAKVLKDSGAKSVWGVVLAEG